MKLGERAVPWPRRARDRREAGWTCAACDRGNVPGTSYCGHCGVSAGTAGVVDEQRLITALFADISGFTTLADRLETAELHRIISPVIGVLTSVAERYGGTIQKYAGDAVLVFFGAPVAYEDHAARAVACAVDMHAALTEALPRLPSEAAGLELHIGVNTGRVIAGMAGGDVRNDYSILGDAVNVAQRLESVATPGETYVGSLTRELAADAFVFEDLGGLTLKGKPEPVPAWRVVGACAAATARATTPSTALVGRDREVAALQGVVTRLVGGTGGITTIVAEPGVGKSRLVEEMRTFARAGGCEWLEARSISYGAAIPYWPFVDLLRRTLGIRLDLDPEVAARLLREEFADCHSNGAELVARLLGVPVDATNEVDALSPEAFNRELSAALMAWLMRLTEARPTVLVIEDVHWTDSASADLLGRLVRLATPTRLQLVLSGRLESAALIQRVAAVADEQRRVDLRLGPLDAAAVAELVERLLGGPVSPSAVDLVLRRAGGNPFFAQEILRTLQDESAIAFRDGRWEVDAAAAAAVPSSVEGVLAARIDRLAPQVANVLAAASVIGRRVDLALLDAVTELEGHLPRRVDALVESGLLDRTVVDGAEVVAFHHALVVDVVYGRLVQRRRRELHRRVAEAAEALYGSGDDVIDLLARHFSLAEAGVKAVDYLERAGNRAKRLYANDQAITHLRCAVELCRKLERLTSRIPRLLLDLADVELLISAYDDAARDYTEVRELTGDVRAWCGLSAVQCKWGSYEDAAALVDLGLTASLFAPDQRAQLLEAKSAALTLAGRLDEVLAAATAGLAEIGDGGGVLAGRLLLRVARAHEMRGDDDGALAYATRARTVLEAAGDQRALALAYRIIGGVHQTAGRHAEAEATCRLGLQSAERTGNAEEVAACLINLGLALLDLERLDEAIDCDVRALDLFRQAGNVMGECNARCNLGEKLLAAGRVRQAISECREGLRLATATGFVMAAADAQRTLARALTEAGEHASAREAAQDAARLFRLLEDTAAADAASALADAVPA